MKYLTPQNLLIALMIALIGAAVALHSWVAFAVFLAVLTAAVYLHTFERVRPPPTVLPSAEEMYDMILKQETQIHALTAKVSAAQVRVPVGRQ